LLGIVFYVVKCIMVERIKERKRSGSSVERKGDEAKKKS